MLIGLVALLKADPGLSALVGGRIFPVELPESPTLPALTFSRAGGSSDPNLTTSGPQRVRVHFIAHSDKKSGGYTAAYQVCEALRHLLNGYTGTFSDAGNVSIDYLQPIDYPFANEARQFECGAEYYINFVFRS